MVLIKAGHEQADLVVGHLEAQVFQAMDQILDVCGACTRFIEDPEGINQVKVSLQTQRNLDLFNVFLKLKLILEDIVDVVVSGCFLGHLDELFNNSGRLIGC